MSARNVRCAGGGRPSNPLLPDGTPCGWKGERYPWDHRPEQGLWGHTEAGMTAKPCPRCSGRVELIPEDEQKS